MRLYTLFSAAKLQGFLHVQNKQSKIMAIPKVPGRDEFFTLIDEIKPKLGDSYSREARVLTPTVDAYRLQRAVNKRHVYWEGLEALRKLVAHNEKHAKSVAA